MSKISRFDDFQANRDLQPQEKNPTPAQIEAFNADRAQSVAKQADSDEIYLCARPYDIWPMPGRKAIPLSPMDVRENSRTRLLNNAKSMSSSDFEKFVKTELPKAQITYKDGKVDQVSADDNHCLFRASWLGDRALRWNDTIGDELFTSGQDHNQFDTTKPESFDQLKKLLNRAYGELDKTEFDLLCRYIQPVGFQRVTAGNVDQIQFAGNTIKLEKGKK